MGRQSHAVINAPFRSLIALFVAWELLLLSIALLSPGLGYDTSTQLLLQGHGIRHIQLPLREAIAHGPSPILDRLLRKLTRWDAIYFASIAEKGYLLEQEWMSGWGFTRLLSFLATCTYVLLLPFMQSFLITPHHNPNMNVFVLQHFAKRQILIYILRLVCLAKPILFPDRPRFMSMPASWFLLRPDRLQGSAAQVQP